jgi:CRISPR-associated protein Cas5d
LLEGKVPPSPLDEHDRNKDLGWMLHDVEFQQNPVTKAVKKAVPRFFHARLEEGVLKVPPFHTSIPAPGLPV